MFSVPRPDITTWTMDMCRPTRAQQVTVTHRTGAWLLPRQRHTRARASPCTIRPTWICSSQHRGTPCTALIWSTDITSTAWHPSRTAATSTHRFHLWGQTWLPTQGRAAGPALRAATSTCILATGSRGCKNIQTTFTRGCLPTVKKSWSMWRKLVEHSTGWKSRGTRPKQVRSSVIAHDQSR